MKHVKYWLAGLIVLVLVFVLYSGGEVVNQKSENKVSIGAISILSGQFASIGQNYANGVVLAKEEFEAKNPNVKVDLHLEDDAFDAKKGVSAYKKLTEVNRVDALINISSPTIDAIHGEVQKKNLPVIQFGIQSSGVGPDSIFQISPSPEVPIQKFAEYIRENASYKKMAIVYAQGEPFESFYDSFLIGLGYQGQSALSLKLKNKEDIQAYATRIAKEQFDAVVILTLPEDGALLVKKIHALGGKDITYVIDVQLQTGLDTYKKILGDLSLLNNGYSVWLASASNTENFKSNYKKRFNVEPGAFADSGYDSFNVLIDAYMKSDRTHAGWIEQIQKARLNGASGFIQFDANGIRNQDLEIKRVLQGEVVTEKEIQLTQK